VESLLAWRAFRGLLSATAAFRRRVMNPLFDEAEADAAAAAAAAAAATN
jgi:hypothetical protein